MTDDEEKDEEIDPEVIDKQIKAINRELIPVSDYLDVSSKSQVMECIDTITNELMKGGSFFKKYFMYAEGVKSTLMSMSGNVKSKGKKKYHYNRLREYLYNVRWHYLRAKGKDVPDEPWDIPKEEEAEETEPEEKEAMEKQIPDNIFTEGAF